MTKNTKYAQLMNEIKMLKEKADAIRSEESKAVIALIKAQMEEHGITAADLGMAGGDAKRPILTRRKPEPKYKDPVTGATWAGRGKFPTWMKAATAKGISKEQFAIA